MQEPAAVLFSVFNLFAHIISLHKFRQAVPSIAPLYKFWHVHALVSIFCRNFFFSVIKRKGYDRKSSTVGKFLIEGNGNNLL